MPFASNVPGNTVGKVLNRKELLTILQRYNPQLSPNSIGWYSKKLVEEGVLQKKGWGKYSFAVDKNARPKWAYQYPFSLQSKQLAKEIEGEYPLVQFIVWEAIQYNDFLNHQIAQNTFFVEADRTLLDALFDCLREKYTVPVLKNPSAALFNEYWARGCIVLLPLVTEAPIDAKNHQSTLEKLLVDCTASKIITQLFQQSEWPTIYENAISTYYVDRTRMLRYAKRRSREELVAELLAQATKPWENVNAGPQDI